eukprot:COSAG02_NODE_4142_length_5722_cov_21.915526_4_plen_70_part_00
MGIVLEAIRTAWERSTGGDWLTRQQLKRMFDAADGSGSNGRNGAAQTERLPGFVRQVHSAHIVASSVPH